MPDSKPPQKTLHVGQPNIGDREIFDRFVDEIFERRWFTNSGVVEQEFEARLTGYLGVRHCIPVCNATVGLQLACQALDLTGEVIVPAFTFVATPHSVAWEGLTPVFADVDPVSHTICPKSVEAKITDKTSAILGVHVWGNACKVEQLDKLARQHALKVFYDSAHAFACAHNGQMIGNFGHCEVFSFHATKFFNTFEGGAIATNDDSLAEKIRLMKNFGFSGVDNVVHLGTNAKMTEICAAMGLSCFAKLDDFHVAYQSNYRIYQRLLDEISGIQMMQYDDEGTNWQYIVAEVDESVTGISRDGITDFLQANHVRARRYFYPGCHNMEPYRTNSPALDGAFPVTDRLCRDVIVLPTGTAVGEAEIVRVCQLIREAIAAS